IRHAAFLYLSVAMGLRLSDLSDLQLNSYYPEIGFIRVIGKGNKERLVPVGEPGQHILVMFFFSSRRRHTRSKRDWSLDVCSSDLEQFLTKFFRKSDFSIGKKRYIFTNDELQSIKKQIQLGLNNTSVANWGTRLALWIDLETGMRPGEVQALKFDNLVVENEYPTFKINDSWSDYARSFNGSLKARPKGYYRYCLPISQSLADFVELYQEEQERFLERHCLKNPQNLIFLNLHDYKTCANSIPITQRSMNEMLKKICDKLGIDSKGTQLSMYSFRHTLCTKLAN